VSKRVQVAGKPAADRLMQQIKYRSRQMVGRYGVKPPNELQVAAVLHALADHTAIMEALRYRPDVTSPWPEAISIGRWLHDVGDDLEDV
jgi:hypothetical protein